MIAAGSLLRDPEPGLYLYRQIRNGQAQLGVPVQTGLSGAGESTTALCATRRRGCSTS
jgi:hypothetical protein